MTPDQIFLAGSSVLALLVLLSIAAATWLMSLINSNNSCQLNPNFWCYNDWACSAPSSKGNTCFAQTFVAPDNLTECIYGPKSAAANACFSGGVATGCGCALTGAENCLASCPTSSADVTCSTYKPDP